MLIVVFSSNWGAPHPNGQCSPRAGIENGAGQSGIGGRAGHQRYKLAFAVWSIVLHDRFGSLRA